MGPFAVDIIKMPTELRETQMIAFSFGKVNLSESVPTAPPIPRFGMNQVRKQFDTIYDARAGPGEVSVGVHGEDAVS